MHVFIIFGGGGGIFVLITSLYWLIKLTQSLAIPTVKGFLQCFANNYNNVDTIVYFLKLGTPAIILNMCWIKKKLLGLTSILQKIKCCFPLKFDNNLPKSKSNIFVSMASLKNCHHWNYHFVAPSYLHFQSCMCKPFICRASNTILCSFSYYINILMNTCLLYSSERYIQVRIQCCSARSLYHIENRLDNDCYSFGSSPFQTSHQHKLQHGN